MTLLFLLALVTVMGLACAVSLALLVSRAGVWWRRRRSVGRPSDRRTGRRLGAGLAICLGLWVMGAAAALPSAPAFKDPRARICFDQGTPPELYGIVGQEATQAEPELVVWPWGFRCTWSHYAYDGTVVIEPGWGHTIAIGVGAGIVATGATTLIRTRGRDRTGEPART